jgi:betaine lipid synthase
MDSLTLNIPRGPHVHILLVGATLFILIGIIFAHTFRRTKEVEEDHNTFTSFLRFFYASFLKPHTGDGTGNGQQDALESFYQAQAGVYDATRKRLLRGREDMLELVAAQLVNKAANERTHDSKRIWVDVWNITSKSLFRYLLTLVWQIGGGTGWNIEAMSAFVSVPDFFSSVYLVDFSPSLCKVARKRFARLGWSNVKVICQDARTFRLEDHEHGSGNYEAPVPSPTSNYFGTHRTESSVGGAELVTLSYSLSMIVSGRCSNPLFSATNSSVA